MVEAIVAVSMIGVSIGSFVNVCAFRLPRRISLFEVSFCDNCKEELGWNELIPIASFVAYLGRCRYCRKRISLQYPFVEFIIGLIAILLFLKFGATLKFLQVSGYAVLMLLVAIVDWQHLIIPNKVITCGLALGIVCKMLFQEDTLPASLVSSLYALSSMLSILLLGNWLLKKESMGMGDVKLAAVVGLFIGFTGFLLSVWLASVGAVIYAMIAKSKTPNPNPFSVRLPFGAFLAISSAVVLVLKQQFFEWIDTWFMMFT